MGRPSGFLFLRFDIDLLTVHGKDKGGQQLPEVLHRILTNNGPPGHLHSD